MMVTARAKGATVCAQHHVPRSQCPPSSGHPRSVRFRDDDWAAAEEAARDRNTDTGPLIILATQAVLGYVRCYRCRPEDPPVPLQCGDLTGRTLAEAITEAEDRAARQHPDHQPVWLGAEPAPACFSRVQGAEGGEDVSTPAFTCPCCGAVSHNATDLEQHYCGRCHWWTGDPELGRDHLAGLCEMRVNPEFAAFKEEMAEMVMDTCEVPEAERETWRGLRQP